MTLTLHITMSSSHKIINRFHLIIFKILTRISSILTSVLKTFINENKKQSILSIKTVIIDAN